MTPDQPQGKKPRSRKLYVLWAIALTLLLATGAFCWLVVVPVWQVHASIERVKVRLTDFDPDLNEILPDEVATLGGKAQALAKVRLYLNMPSWTCPRKDVALELLGWCGRDAVPIVSMYASSKDANERGAAMQALGDIGAEARRAYPLAERALRDKDPAVRRCAAYALGTFGDRRAVSPLVAALSDDDKTVRANAVFSLGEMGPEAHVAIPAIRKLLQDPSLGVQRCADAALKKIKAAQEKEAEDARARKQASLNALPSATEVKMIAEPPGFAIMVDNPLDKADAVADKAWKLQKAGKSKEAAAARKKAVKLYLKAEAEFLKLPRTSFFYEESLYLAGIACYQIMRVLSGEGVSPTEKKGSLARARRTLSRFKTYEDWIKKHPPKSRSVNPKRAKSDLAHIKRRRASHATAIRLYTPYIHADLGNWEQVQSAASAILVRPRSLADPLLKKKDLSPWLKNSLRNLLVKANAHLASRAGGAKERAKHLCAAAKHLRHLSTAAEKSSDTGDKKKLRDPCSKHLSLLADGLRAGAESAETVKLLQQDEDGRWLLEKIKVAEKKDKK